MANALARCLPEHGRRDALATLSGMVGAVVLARLADDPDLADELLAATREAACSR
jgi:TetR/AcrR family transcriptional repressor of nem operon